MDWNGAIEVNRVALVRIVAALVAVVEGYGAALWLPLYVHHSVARLLRPAESAVRRLILIAARKVVVGVPHRIGAARNAPTGLLPRRGARAKRRGSFRLFDPLRRFVDYPAEARVAGPTTLPGIRILDGDPLVPLFLRSSVKASAGQARAPDGFISVRTISRRLAAAQFALDDIPQQAKRLLRHFRRGEPQHRRLVLRPGPPPGHVKKPKDDIHLVLQECHALARHALVDSS